VYYALFPCLLNPSQLITQFFPLFLQFQLLFFVLSVSSVYPQFPPLHVRKLLLTCRFLPFFYRFPQYPHFGELHFLFDQICCFPASSLIPESFASLCRCRLMPLGLSQILKYISITSFSAFVWSCISLKKLKTQFPHLSFSETAKSVLRKE